MKPTVVSADVLFEDHRGTLHWEWVAGLGASERRFDEADSVLTDAVRVLRVSGVPAFAAYGEVHRRWRFWSAASSAS